MSFWLFFFGYTVVSLPISKATNFFELCRSLGVTPDWQKHEGEDLFCRLSARGYARLKRSQDAMALSLSLKEAGGVPAALRHLLGRPALLIGLAAALALLVAGRLFLWEVRVEGNRDISHEELTAALAETGLERGRFIPLLDSDEIALSLRCADARLAYVAVNIKGTVATVQIREAEPEPEPVFTAPAHLVAARDGIVTMPLVFEGHTLVEPGERVRAGQTLVSGVLPTTGERIYTTRAAGQVLARTETVYRVFVPFAYEERIYTGRIRYQIDAYFFGLSGKVFKNTGNMLNTCDIIKTEHTFAPGGAVLPFGFSVTAFREYKSMAAIRTVADAQGEAMKQLNALLANAGSERALLERHTETQISEDGITLCCTAVFEEKIAAVVEFDADDVVRN